MKFELVLNKKRIVHPEFFCFSHNDRKDVLIIGIKEPLSDELKLMMQSLKNKAYKIKMQCGLLEVLTSRFIFVFNIEYGLNKILSHHSYKWFNLTFALTNENGILKNSNVNLIKMEIA